MIDLQLGDSLCEDCVYTEEQKCSQWDSVDLNNRTALVTGARIKIGYPYSLIIITSIIMI